jgi:DNA mismatch endonuclease, patch repair protein
MEKPATRSRIMQAVKSKDTSPELLVRRVLRRLGYRFQCHRKDLSGCPDFVFVRRKKIIFMHGCFWHGHNCRRGARIPKTNTEYWIKKVARNRQRDANSVFELKALGWHILVLWECELRDEPTLSNRVRKFLTEQVC